MVKVSRFCSFSAQYFAIFACRSCRSQAEFGLFPVLLLLAVLFLTGHSGPALAESQSKSAEAVKECARTALDTAYRDFGPLSPNEEQGLSRVYMDLCNLLLLRSALPEGKTDPSISRQMVENFQAEIRLLAGPQADTFLELERRMATALSAIMTNHDSLNSQTEYLSNPPYWMSKFAQVCPREYEDHSKLLIAILFDGSVADVVFIDFTVSDFDTALKHYVQLRRRDPQASIVPLVQMVEKAEKSAKNLQSLARDVRSNNVLMQNFKPRQICPRLSSGTSIQ